MIQDDTSLVDKEDYFAPVDFGRLFGSALGTDWTINHSPGGIASTCLVRTAASGIAEGVSHHEMRDGTRVRFQFFPPVIGLDTEEGSGIVGGIVGGYLIIGDVGAIIKNTVRNYGWSDVEPNNFELILAGAGLIGTFSGPGDGIINSQGQAIYPLLKVPSRSAGAGES